jgi:hypothetical protein
MDVQSAEFARLVDYLHQIDGVIRATVEAYEETLPEAARAALWGATSLTKLAVSLAEEMQVSPPHINA